MTSNLNALLLNILQLRSGSVFIYQACPINKGFSTIINYSIIQIFYVLKKVILYVYEVLPIRCFLTSSDVRTFPRMRQRRWQLFVLSPRCCRIIISNSRYTHTHTHVLDTHITTCPRVVYEWRKKFQTYVMGCYFCGRNACVYFIQYTSVDRMKIQYKISRLVITKIFYNVKRRLILYYDSPQGRHLPREEEENGESCAHHDSAGALNCII